MITHAAEIHIKEISKQLSGTETAEAANVKMENIVALWRDGDKGQTFLVSSDPFWPIIY